MVPGGGFDIGHPARPLLNNRADAGRGHRDRETDAYHNVRAEPATDLQSPASA